MILAVPLKMFALGHKKIIYTLKTATPFIANVILMNVSIINDTAVYNLKFVGKKI